MVWKPIRKGLLSLLLGLSALRYLIFSFQYYMLLLAMQVDMPFLQAMIFISVIYLVLTAIPSIALADIGIRGSVALFFFGMVSDNTTGILLATLLLWFINIVLPALIGYIYVWKMKVYKSGTLC